MTYSHGVYIQEEATAITPARRVTASLPVFVGLAPTWKTDLHRLDAVNIPILCESYADFQTYFGEDDTWTDYTLCEAAWAFFQVYGMGPAVFINAFDPYVDADHHVAPATITQALVAGTLVVSTGDPLAAVEGILIDGVVVQDTDDDPVYVKDTDYTIAYDADFHVVITRIATGDIPEATSSLKIIYEVAKPSGVDADDIILALGQVDQVYVRHSLIPGQIVAPLWSIDQSVAASMLAHAENIDDSFRCIALVDIDTDVTLGADDYSEVNAIKAAASIDDTQIIACWPLVTTGSGASLKTYHLSSHLAALIATTDLDAGSLPYVSPSNKSLEISGAVTAAGDAVFLTRAQANTLNGQGVVTPLNWEGGWRAWGNRTACYPGTTDPKDSFIPNRRMMNYVGNVAVSTFFDKVDQPISRRVVQSIQDSVNDWLNGMVGKGALLSGTCDFLSSDNPVSSVIDGQVTFRVALGLQGPAEVITFILAMDANAVSALWTE